MSTRSSRTTGFACEDNMAIDDPFEYLPPAESSAEPGPPAWAAPALLFSLLMLGFDLVALIPLGAWMRDYGIGLVSTIYLLHVLGSTAVAAWTMSLFPLQPDTEPDQRNT
ncbi:hypothetical protein [Nocardia alba]|uniref:hypothetical protein n=1 Tax=Nocardia alba TaxID=225051 RepID=UPI00104982C3|nr:hypothetical protein [Nocardia alba]